MHKRLILLAVVVVQWNVVNVTTQTKEFSSVKEAQDFVNTMPRYHPIFRRAFTVRTYGMQGYLPKTYPYVDDFKVTVNGKVLYREKYDWE